MSLVACALCRQPFYASCHDCSCLDAVCPYCEYGDRENGDALRVSDKPLGALAVRAAALSSSAQEEVFMSHMRVLLHGIAEAEGQMTEEARA
jgi:hypothetical protein